MVQPLKLRNLWRVVREVDLESIRTGAKARVTVIVVAGDRSDAERAAARIGGTDAAGGRHPWVIADAPGALSSIDARTVTLAIFVSPGAELAPACRELRERLASGGVPVLTVVEGVTGAPAEAPRGAERGRIAVAALDDEALRALGRLIAATMPDVALAVARQLVPLRTGIFDRLIDDTSAANASYALSTGLAEVVPVLTAPLNLGDVVILTKNQLVLGYKIALGAGHDGSPRELMTEVAGVLGGGLLLRQVARQLVGLIPVAGLVAKVAVAYAGTWAIGHAVELWATRGRDVTVDSMRALYGEGIRRGRRMAESLVARVGREASTRTSRRERWRRFLSFRTPGGRQRASTASPTE